MNRRKRIPFGKHRGKVIAELPIQYLLWLYNTVDLDRWGIRTAVQEALGLADEEEDDDYCPDMGETEEQLEVALREKQLLERRLLDLESENHNLKERMRTAYKRLAMKFHPDRGGDRDMMSLINELLNWK